MVIIEMRVVFVRKTRIGTLVFSLNLELLGSILFEVDNNYIGWLTFQSIPKILLAHNLFSANQNKNAQTNMAPFISILQASWTHYS